jgi:hypothetical protein
MRYPADPPTVEEIIAVMRHAGDNRHGWRLRALIVVLGVVVCASRRRSRSPSPTLTLGVGLCSCATARAAVAARSGWMPGAGSSYAPGSPPVAICLSGHCSASSTVPRAIFSWIGQQK